MAELSKFEMLVRELERVRSPLQRMKVLALSWRSLRGLDPEQRRNLAMRVGLEGAEDLVENLGQGDRASPSAVLRAIRKAREADPADLRRLIADLRDPARRGGVLGAGLARLLGDPAIPPPESPSEPRNDAGRSTPDGATPTVPAAAAPPPAVPARPAVASFPSPVPRRAVSRRPAPEAPPPAGGGLAARPRPGREGERPPGPARPPVVDPTTPSAGLPPPPTSPPRRGSVEERPVRGPADLPARLVAARGPLQRLRRLRQGIDGARDLPEAALVDLLETFPAGWCRRRALDALLAAGIPASLPAARRLVDELESPADRRWCLGTILHRWDLSAAERGEIDRQRWPHRARGAM